MSKCFDEKYMPTISEMVNHLKDSKLRDIGLTLQFGKEEWEFKLGKVIDRFSEDHPYCRKDCDYCLAGKHSSCTSTETCHDTDNENHWVDLD